MKNIKNKLLAVVLATGGLITSCSLDEVNPGGMTMVSLSTSLDGYQALVNNCYFGMERRIYGTEYWMFYSEANSDLWTYASNKSTSYQQWMWFYAGAAPNTTYTLDLWNVCYDGIAACNMVIAWKDNPPFATEEERNAKVAEAYFMRSMYYYNLVEVFGGVVKLTEPQVGADYSPVRTSPEEIYNDIILPGFEFAAQWLPIGTDATTTIPTRKAAKAFLAKAYLSMVQYNDNSHVEEALNITKDLITDCEGGGTLYNTYMYEDYDDIFKESNNYNNKEALWKHRWNENGSSNGNYKLNFYDQKFLCNIYSFGAMTNTYEYRMTWEGDANGQFMPTQHLLNLFVQEDGSLDPRFHKIFTTEWKANQDYTWSADAAANFKKDPSIEGTSVNIGELAIKFVMPQDQDYAQEVAQKKNSSYLLVDYKDVYDDVNRKVIDYDSDGVTENLLHAFYPSLNKHNSSNYFVANASKGRIGNLNATFIMRMAEVYLLAAEADILSNGGHAMDYINKVRERAGANPLKGTATIRTLLDERARELCGEGHRFFDLKRLGMFKDASYLQETHPDLAKFFKPEYALHPIPTTYTDGLDNGSDPMWQNPGY